MIENYLVQPVLPVGAGAESANATAQQDALARSRGFRNYNEMILWARQRAQQQGGTIPQGGAGQMPRSWGEATRQVSAMHPKTMLEYVQRKIDEAIGGGQ